uniref:MYND-type domain-containing protein n=1 Tax=Macrostomum lignano TaxID=282301 RepID=A0A1I8J3U0_9PLAT
MISNPFSSAFFAQCSTCAGLLNRSSALQCSQCRCVYYCSEACQRRHANQPDNPGLAHKAWCARLRLFRQRAPALAELPFGFASVTTADTFDSQCLSRFLLERGLLGRGMWRRECYAWLGVHPHPFDDDDNDADIGGVPLPGDLAPDPDPFALPDEAAVLVEAPSTVSATEPPPRISSWSDYYQMRGLPADSPVCVLMQWPLTLYHLLFERLPVDAPDAYKRLTATVGDNRPCQLRRIVVHLIGVEKEVELIPALCELAKLAPGFSFRLVLVGKVAAGLLNQKHQDGITDSGDEESSCPARPDLIVAFNAGFAASISWPATLEFLKKLAIRTYVTDYCEFSMELSAVMCDKLGIGTLTPQRINPFRSPIRVPNEQLDLPSYSNAFISELVYPA